MEPRALHLLNKPSATLPVVAWFLLLLLLFVYSFCFVVVFQRNEMNGNQEQQTISRVNDT